ncbi:hypothetical protein AT395_24125 [Pandoraea apista]|nr:hypothetical protein AT395_24125 [Pandoraea apista]RRX05927.1 hypothetical protein EGJ56_04895 [Pandoraea apista]
MTCDGAQPSVRMPISAVLRIGLRKPATLAGFVVYARNGMSPYVSPGEIGIESFPDILRRRACRMVLLFMATISETSS